MFFRNKSRPRVQRSRSASEQPKQPDLFDAPHPPPFGVPFRKVEPPTGAPKPLPRGLTWDRLEELVCTAAGLDPTKSDVGLWVIRTWINNGAEADQILRVIRARTHIKVCTLAYYTKAIEERVIADKSKSPSSRRSAREFEANPAYRKAVARYLEEVKYDPLYPMPSRKRFAGHDDWDVEWVPEHEADGGS